jgi:phosphoribosyl 1,2-cyclic phosphodiesterase
MGAEVYPLASGSLGNALLVRSERDAVLVDMGLTQRRLRASLAAAGVEPQTVAALLVTHTHRDHFSTSAAGWCLREGVPVYSSRENLQALARREPRFAKCVRAGLARPLDGEDLAIGSIRVRAFDLPHDAPGRCVGFRFTVGRGRRRRVATVATDLGHLPTDRLDRFVDSDVLVIESNHDPVMLFESGRPPDLIDRIAGPHGHLSNDDSAEAVAEIVGRSRRGRVKHVLLAHLSRDCNTPRMALEAQAHLVTARTPAVHFAAADQFDPGPFVAL